MSVAPSSCSSGPIQPLVIAVLTRNSAARPTRATPASRRTSSSWSGRIPGVREPAPAGVASGGGGGGGGGGAAATCDADGDGGGSWGDAVVVGDRRLGCATRGGGGGAVEVSGPAATSRSNTATRPPRSDSKRSILVDSSLIDASTVMGPWSSIRANGASGLPPKAPWGIPPGAGSPIGATATVPPWQTCLAPVIPSSSRSRTC